MKDLVDHLENRQNFRAGRKTVDQIFDMCQSVEKCFEYDIDLNIDQKQAFDNVSEFLYKLWISNKIIRLMEMTLKDNNNRKKNQ